MHLFLPPADDRPVLSSDASLVAFLTDHDWLVDGERLVALCLDDDHRVVGVLAPGRLADLVLDDHLTAILLRPAEAMAADRIVIVALDGRAPSPALVRQWRREATAAGLDPAGWWVTTAGGELIRRMEAA